MVGEHLGCQPEVARGRPRPSEAAKMVTELSIWYISGSYTVGLRYEAAIRYDFHSGSSDDGGAFVVSARGRPRPS